MTKHRTLKLRQATLDDLEQLCDIRNNEDLFLKYFDECDGSKAYFLIAETEGKIGGFGLVYLDVTKNGKRKSHLPKMSDLYVAEDYRKNGIATALIKAKENLARQYGHSQLHISIDPFESTEMLSLAKKLSYTPLQSEPYLTSALHYDLQGNGFEKQYFRLDFKKTLD